MGVLALSIVIACEDPTRLTAPTPVAPVAPRVDVGPAGATIVSPADMHGWWFSDDATGGVCTDGTRCRFVEGPAATPLGTGSAELAATDLADATLVLDAYAGTRLDHITALGYSTYRQSVNAANNLAVTLQLNVDYDLKDKFTGEMGRLVYEPFKTSKGKVLQGTWQSWDTRTGLWWGTKANVRVGGVLVSNPCVQATPCSWPALITRFPNIGIHPLGGGVVLKSRPNAGFVGNVDKLVIGIDGTTTTYDFESRATPPPPVTLTVLTDEGVSGLPASSDTAYSPGATVPYDFQAPSDGRILTVYLDGVAVPTAGTVQMNGPHSLFAVLRSDMTLKPSDQALFEAIRAVLTASDPAPPFQSLMDLVGKAYSELGETEADARLSRATAAAIDPKRDSASLWRVDAALGGHVFDINAAYVPPVDTFTASGRGRAKPSGASRGKAMGAGPLPVGEGRGTAEPTAIFFVNGVGKSFPQATATQGHLGALLRRNVPRFRDPNDVVMRLFYNRNEAAQIGVDVDRNLAMCLSGLTPDLTAVMIYIACRATKVVDPVHDLIADLLEAKRILSSKTLPTSGPVVVDIGNFATELDAYGTAGRNVVIMPHSEGNLITERALEELVRRRVFKANGSPTCIAVTPMASPTVHYGPIPSRYVMPTQLEGDIVLLAPRADPMAENFPASPNTLNDRFAAQRANGGWLSQNMRYLRQLLDGIEMHGMESYLSRDGGRAMVMAAAEQAYDACATRSVEIAGGPPDTDSLLIGESVQLYASAVNGALDPVVGKTVTWTSNSFATVTQTGYVTVAEPGGGTIGARVGLEMGATGFKTWSKPPIITAVSCTKGASREQNNDYITKYTSTITAQASSPLAPIVGYHFELEIQNNSSGVISTEYFNGGQEGNSAWTEHWFRQWWPGTGEPTGDQWLATGRCYGRVYDRFGKRAEMYGP